MVAYVNRLPDELLFLVFEHYVCTYYGLPEVLLLVCRLWHALATRLPRLWTPLDFQRRVSTCVPLGYPVWMGSFIWARCIRSNPMPLDLDFTFLNHYINREAIFLQFIQIPGIVDRCRSLVITQNYELAILRHSSGLPYLEELAIGNYGVDKDITLLEPLQWRPELCPRFRSLDIYNFYGENWPSTLFELPLRLTVSIGLHIPETSSIFAPLEIAINVRDLTLNVDFDFIYEEEDRGIILECPPLTLRHVTHLSIHYENENLVSLRHPFRNLTFPSLTSLEVDLWSIVYLQGILLVPIHTLRQFTFVCPDRTHIIEPVLDVLKMVPNIDHLGLSLVFYNMEGIVLGLENDSLLCRNLRTLECEGRSEEISMNRALEARVEERFKALQGWILPRDAPVV